MVVPPPVRGDGGAVDAFLVTDDAQAILWMFLYGLYEIFFDVYLRTELCRDDLV